MAKQRTTIALNEDEVWAFVAQQRDMHVATINKDGTPHLTTNWFALPEERQIAFNSYEGSQKMVNLRRDPRVTLLFADGETYGELRGASIKGRVRFTDDPAENVAVMQAIYERNKAYTEPRISGDSTPQSVASKRICVVVEVDRVISWDHRKLAENRGS